MLHFLQYYRYMEHLLMLSMYWGIFFEYWFYRCCRNFFLLWKTLMNKHWKLFWHFCSFKAVRGKLKILALPRRGAACAAGPGAAPLPIKFTRGLKGFPNIWNPMYVVTKVHLIKSCDGLYFMKQNHSLNGRCFSKKIVGSPKAGDSQLSEETRQGVT